MSRERIVILGAGGEVPQYLEALELRAERGGPAFEIVALLDDVPALEGRQAHGCRVAGPLARVAEWPETRLLWGLGNVRCPGLRLEISYRLGLSLERFVSLVHPDAFVSRRAVVGPGTTVLGGSRVTAGTRIGPHVLVSFNCVVEHDTVVGPGTLLASGCLLAGGVRIGAGAYLGQGCNIKENVSVGRQAIVGMGAVVLKDVADGQTVVGNPARVLRTKPLSDEFGAWVFGLE